jgi:PhoPQ-activated pathogenicity-related protein
MGNLRLMTQMRNRIIIFTLTVLLFSCNSKTEKKSTEVESADSSTSDLTNNYKLQSLGQTLTAMS